MSSRALFQIIVKICGLYLCVQFIAYLPTIFYIITPEEFSVESLFANFNFLIYFILMVGYYFGMIYFLLFRTNLIVDRLRLDEGFEEENFNFHPKLENLIKVSIILVGLYLIIISLPNLISNIIEYLFFGKNNEYFEFAISDKIVFPFIQFLMGILTISERSRIYFLIHKKEDNVKHKE